MVGIGVDNGETAQGADFPHMTQGNDDIIETAGSPEGFLTGMMAAGADETKGPVQFPRAKAAMAATTPPTDS